MEAVSGVCGKDFLEVLEDAVETQQAPTTFDRVSRSRAMMRRAAITSVMSWRQSSVGAGTLVGHSVEQPLDGKVAFAAGHIAVRGAR